MNKTLEKLKEYIESGAYKYSGPVICKEEVQMCIDALEKQIAKKVINKQPNPCTGIIGNCCRCGNGAYTINPTFTYCIWCGQKLDWSGIDE